MIVHDPRLISDELLIVGRQVRTSSGGIIDLLAMYPDGSVALIEIKRDRTPRDVVAQALDYASWVDTLTLSDLEPIFARLVPGGNLAAAFRGKFKAELEAEELNQSHQIIIVAAELDASTERIVKYLGDRDVPINVLCFQVFATDAGQLVGRTWLLDPLELQTAVLKRKQGSEPWNGEFYCSYGLGESRSWDEAVRYGFVCAGGGVWYSRTLRLLEPGDRLWVKIPGEGFVGVCRVTGTAQRALDFTLRTSAGERPALEVLTGGHYHRDDAHDEELCEYFVPVDWLDHKPLEQAVHDAGMFGNQNSICRPTVSRWRTTVERLKAEFPDFDKQTSEPDVVRTPPPATIAD